MTVFLNEAKEKNVKINAKTRPETPHSPERLDRPEEQKFEKHKNNQKYYMTRTRSSKQKNK